MEDSRNRGHDMTGDLRKCAKCGGRIVPATISVTGRRVAPLYDHEGKRLEMCEDCRTVPEKGNA